MLSQRMMMTAGGKGEFIDTTGAPGPTELIGGDESAGYFGRLEATELWDSGQLAAAVGVTQGVIRSMAALPWMKFVLDGKILFVATRAIRQSISWDHLNWVNCVFGNKTISKNGIVYKVRLLKGARDETYVANSANMGAIGSEWNRLILPIHVNASTGNWTYPEKAGQVESWGVNLYDADLGIGTGITGNGGNTWCQETQSGNTQNALSKGWLNVERSLTNPKTSRNQTEGWRPVLEVV
jgi:hypothetical protein